MTKSSNQRVYVIAEAGSNHNQDWSLALRLIDTACEAGADAVKFQVFYGNTLYAREVKMARYLVAAGKASEEDRLADLMSSMQLDRSWLPRLAEACRQRSIDFLATPFDLPAVAQLQETGVPYFKVASSEINNFHLLAAVAECQKPVFLSTGMARLADIERAVDFLESHAVRDLTLLHCTAAYPTPIEDAHIRAMSTLEKTFGYPVGFSDHTQDEISAVLAVGLGATVIEKHFTMDRSLPGPDHAFAATPEDLKAYVSSIRRAERALGSPRIRVANAEADVVQYRTGLVLGRPVRAGEVLTEDVVLMKRPGWGIPPQDLDIVVGHRVLRDLEEDHILTWSDFLA